MDIKAKNRQTENAYFCILPWLHLYVDPRGEVYPCCLSDPSKGSLGNLGSKSLDSIWNSDELIAMRRDIRFGQKMASGCNYCYQQDKASKSSARQRYNHFFGELVDEDLINGLKPQLKLKYLDFRFSNLCNLKCRTCNESYSSSWGRDSRKLGIKKNKVMSSDTRSKLLDFYFSQIENVEKIYFAGGEPLLIEHHYRALEKLIELKKYNTHLFYSSNASVLRFEKWDVVKLWQNFKNIIFTVSIDHVEDKFDILRSGASWTTTLNNIAYIKQYAPHVKIIPNLTLSNMNVLDLAEILEVLVEKGLIDKEVPTNFMINTVYTPDYFHVSVLTPGLRNEAIKNIQQFRKKIFQSKKIILHQLNVVLNELTEDRSHLVDTFVQKTMEIDKIRNESFFEIFGKLKSLKENKMPGLNI